MSRTIFFFLVSFALSSALFPVASLAITADELRALSGQANKVQREKAGRFKHGDLRGLVREQKQTIHQSENAVNQSIPSPVLDDESHAEAKPNTKVEQQSTGDELKKPSADEYIPPPREIVEQKIITDAVVFDRKSFGIKLGTWITGKLTRKVNNLEQGQVVITITEPIKGKRKILPLGTELFAEKIYNPGTRRLEIQISHGVTPAGDEFALQASVYDELKLSGLSGLVKEKKVAIPGFKKGLLAGSSQVVSDLSPNNPFGTVASTTANTVISNENQVVSKILNRQYIIYVNQQALLIRVNQSF